MIRSLCSLTFFSSKLVFCSYCAFSFLKNSSFFCNSLLVKAAAYKLTLSISPRIFSSSFSIFSFSIFLVLLSSAALLFMASISFRKEFIVLSLVVTSPCFSSRELLRKFVFDSRLLMLSVYFDIYDYCFASLFLYFCSYNFIF